MERVRGAGNAGEVRERGRGHRNGGEGAGGWRGCGEARAGNAGKGQGLRRLSIRRGK